MSPSSAQQGDDLPRRSTSKCGARYRRTCRGSRDLSGLDEALARRIDAAATANPGTTGRAGRLVESTLGLLRNIVGLRGGVAAKQVTAILLRLSDRNKQALEDVRAARLPQLVAPLKTFERVLKNTADSLDAAPKLGITLAGGWAGSAGRLRLERPPGGDLVPWSWRRHGGADHRRLGPGALPSEAEVRGVRDLGAGETGAYALALGCRRERRLARQDRRDVRVGARSPVCGPRPYSTSRAARSLNTWTGTASRPTSSPTRSSSTSPWTWIRCRATSSRDEPGGGRGPGVLRSGQVPAAAAVLLRHPQDGQDQPAPPGPRLRWSGLA